MKSQNVTERYLFFPKFQMVQLKWIVSQFTCWQSHFYVNIHASRNDDNNILTSSGLNTTSFLTIHIFRKYVTWEVVC